ncbi:MAG: hypothetical protein ACR2O5_05750 [Thiogranum sp.]
MMEKKDNTKEHSSTEPDNAAEQPEALAKLNTLPHLLFNISEMNQTMKAMTANTAFMSRDMGMMNQNVGRPMSFMNSFSPW